MSKIVNRTIDCFEAFAEHKRPLSLTELMKVMDIPVSSCHDVVQALETRGYLYELRPRGGYYPTARLHQVARTIVEHDPLMARVESVLEGLRDAVQESVFLVKPNGFQLIYLAVLEPDIPLRFSATVGAAVRNCYATSAGKAYLASLSQQQLKAYLEQTELAPLTARTVNSKAALQRDLRESEARGWFLNREESVEEATTLSARFTWHGALYIVTIAGAAKRVERKLDDVVEALLHAVHALDERKAA